MKRKIYLIAALVSLIALGVVNKKSTTEKAFTPEQIQNIEALTVTENGRFPCLPSPTRSCFLLAQDGNKGYGILRIDGMVHV